MLSGFQSMKHSKRMITPMDEKSWTKIEKPIVLQMKGEAHKSQPKVQVSKQMSDANVCVSEEEFSIRMVDQISGVKTTNLKSSVIVSPKNLDAMATSGDLTLPNGGA